MALAVVSIFLAYMLGSVPLAYILVRLAKGVDIRTAGSLNVGALNAWSQLGVPAGVAVLLADASKGAVGYLLPTWLGAPDWAPPLAAAAVIVGHNWPVFLGFRGGKGASTLLGVGLAMAPILALIGLAVGIVLLLTLRHMIFAVSLALITFNILTIAIKEDADVIALGLLLTVLVVVTYLSRSYRPIVAAFRQRRWRDVIFPR